MQLMRRETFLTGRHQPVGENPFVQGNVTALHDSSDSDGESFIAGITMEQAGTMRLAVEPVYPLCLTAMRAVGTVWPADRL